MSTSNQVNSSAISSVDDVLYVLRTERKREASVQEASDLAASQSRPVKGKVAKEALAKQAQAGSLASGAGGQASNSDASELLSLTAPIQALEQDSNISDPDNQSLIAIIGKALALQAKENSTFWSTEFKDASISMRQAVAFAPMIYNSTINKYNANSDQTKAQATSAMWQGIINVGVGALIIGMAAFDAIKTMNSTPKSPTTEFEDETEGASNSLKESDDGAQNATNNAQNDLNQADQSLTRTQQLARTATSGMKGAGRGFSLFMKALIDSGQRAQGFKALGDGASQLVDMHFKNVEADALIRAGKADAQSQEFEQFAQYYNQNFTRSEDLRGGSQNNIDTSMQILKSIADTMTQTTQSMFRG